MIERYSRPEMAALWSEERQLAIWQEVEALVLDGWSAVDVAPEGAAAAARAAAVDPTAWKAREAETHHDVAAFVDVLGDAMQEHGRWAHFGITSSDLLDTALAVRLREAGDLLSDGLLGLFATIQQLAVTHRDTAMVGRTHGMWAEPTTFGHKLAGFGFQIVNSHHRLLHATHTVSYAKVSGAVGNHATVPREVELHVAEALGLNAEPAATQVVSRDRHATFMNTLAVIGAVLERLAIEVRHLQRSEVAEVAEPFTEGQKGSSAMPHKHNPILSENVTGVARLLRGYAAACMENIALWHERDISHSSVERVAIPDACLTLDFAIARMNRVMSGLTVDVNRMRSNLEATNGTVFSQNVLLSLVRHGMERDAAYRVVQQASLRATRDGIHLRTALEADAEMPLDAVELEAAFDLITLLSHAADSVDHLATIKTEWMGSRTVV